MNKLFEQKNMPLDPDFVDQTVDVGRYPYLPGIGTLYALPHVGNVELFAYRKDLFAKYGLTYPPKTWSDVLAAAKKINEGEPEIHGIVFRGKKGNPIIAGFLPMFWAFGAKVVGKMEIISPPGQKVESSPMIGIWLLGIPKAAKRKDSALDFLPDEIISSFYKYFIFLQVKLNFS